MINIPNVKILQSVTSDNRRGKQNRIRVMERFGNFKIPWKIVYVSSLVAQLVKQSACNAGDWGSIPGLGRSPGKGNGNPLQYFCLENSMDRIVHGVAKSWTWMSSFHFHFQVYMLKNKTINSTYSPHHLLSTSRKQCPAFSHSLVEFPR